MEYQRKDLFCEPFVPLGRKIYEAARPLLLSIFSIWAKITALQIECQEAGFSHTNCLIPRCTSKRFVKTSLSCPRLVSLTVITTGESTILQLSLKVESGKVQVDILFQIFVSKGHVLCFEYMTFATFLPSSTRQLNPYTVSRCPPSDSRDRRTISMLLPVFPLPGPLIPPRGDKDATTPLFLSQTLSNPCSPSKCM